MRPELTTASKQNPTGIPSGKTLSSRLIIPILLGTVLQALNSSMIAVAMVDIRDDFGAGTSASWLISGMYLACAVGAPAAGRLADMFGPRRVFIASITLVAIASAVAPFAGSVGWLIALRVALGLGTCAAYPAGVAMIRAEADQRGTATPTGALSALAVAGQVMVALGPAVGGVLVQWQGWPAIFLVNLPFVVISGALAALWLPKDPPRKRTSTLELLRSLDVLGMLLFVGVIATLMLFLLSLGGDPQWWLTAAFAALLAAFVVVELRVAEPFVDLRLLTRNRALVLTFLRVGLTYVAFYAVFYGLPAWLEEARGLSTGQVGLLMLPIAGVATIVTVSVTRVLRTRGYWPVLLAGSVVFLFGGLALTMIDAHTSALALFALAALLGLPNGFNNIGNQTAMYQAAEADHVGMASGLFRTSQYVAANLSSVVIELCFLWGSAGPIPHGVPTDGGMHLIGTVIACISAVLMVGAGIGMRRRLRTARG